MHETILNHQKMEEKEEKRKRKKNKEYKLTFIDRMKAHHLADKKALKDLEAKCLINNKVKNSTTIEEAIEILNKGGKHVDLDNINVDTDNVYDMDLMKLLRSKMHHSKERSSLNVFLTA